MPYRDGYLKKSLNRDWKLFKTNKHGRFLKRSGFLLGEGDSSFNFTSQKKFYIYLKKKVVVQKFSIYYMITVHNSITCFNIPKAQSHWTYLAWPITRVVRRTGLFSLSLSGLLPCLRKLKTNNTSWLQVPFKLGLSQDTRCSAAHQSVLGQMQTILSVTMTCIQEGRKKKKNQQPGTLLHL